MKKFLWMAALVTALAVVFAGCNGSDTPTTIPPTEIDFENLIADGDPWTTTTQLTLVLSEVVEGLAKENIVLSGPLAEEIEIGSFGRIGGPTSKMYSAQITGLETGGELTVALVKDDYKFNPSSHNVTVYYYDNSNDTPITLEEITADGSENAGTTKLFLKFSQEITGLEKSDITITPNATGAQAGELTHINDGEYELTLTGITTSGEIGFSVGKDGWLISGRIQTVMVYAILVFDFESLEADGEEDFYTTNLLTLTFSGAIPGFTIADISFSGITGVTGVEMSHPLPGEYDLEVTGITESGNLTVTIAKTGMIFNPAFLTVPVIYYDASNDTPVEFVSLTADGDARNSTTTLTLTFDAEIPGLAVTDLTLNPYSTGASMGALTPVGGGVYELALESLSAGGELSIRARKAGFAIEHMNRYADVYYWEPIPVEGSVYIQGDAIVTRSITASLGFTDTFPIGYQWLRDGVAIDNATSTSYTVTADDAGKKLSIAVTRTGYTGQITSREELAFYGYRTESIFSSHQNQDYLYLHRNDRPGPNPESDWHYDWVHPYSGARGLAIDNEGHLIVSMRNHGQSWIPAQQRFNDSPEEGRIIRVVLNATDPLGTTDDTRPVITQLAHQWTGYYAALHPVTEQIYYVRQWGHDVRRYPKGGTVWAEWEGGMDNGVQLAANLNTIGGGSGENMWGGLAVDANGTVYVADPQRHRILKILADGTATVLAGSGSSGNVNGIGSAATFNNPEGVAVDSATGNVYVADTGNGRIRMITPDGEVTTFAGGTRATNAGNTTITGAGSTARLRAPRQITIGPDGNIYFTEHGDAFSNLIRKVTPEGYVTTIGGWTQGTGNTDGLTTGSTASGATGANTAYPTRFNNARGIAVAADGTIYVLDNANAENMGDAHSGARLRRITRQITAP